MSRSTKKGPFVAPELMKRVLEMNEKGEKIEEKVPVGCAHYERVYDNLVAAIEQGAEKIIKDEEVIRVLEILEEATAVAKSHAD